MSGVSGSIDPSEWFGRLQRSYLAAAEESILDELTDIGRLLAVTGIPVESVLETHADVLSEALANPASRRSADLIQAATICLSEVLVAWRIAAEGLGDQTEEFAGGVASPSPFFLRFDRDGQFTDGVPRDGFDLGGLSDDWTANTLDQALYAWGVGSRRADVHDAIGQRRLMTFDVYPSGAADRVVRAVICPFRDGSGIIGIHDVSARRAVAEAVFQRRKLESLGQLAGGIAHEINNLLQPVLTAAQFICEDHAGDAELMADARVILDSARAAADVVKDVLAFARRGAARLEPMRLADAIRQELALIRQTLPYSVALREEYEDAAATIAGNSGELGQILRNLIGNATDAMNGAGTVTVSISRIELGETQAIGMLMPAGRYVRLSVADTGGGIDPVSAQRIFEPFFTTKAIGKGTGLGLAIVRGIVQSWGAAIALRGGGQCGTVFDILLPALADACPPEAETARMPAFGDGAMVVVVDDDTRVGAAIARRLQRAGFRTQTFSSPLDALDCFGGGGVQLVVTDLVMPAMDGFAFIKEIHRRHGFIPVLLLTGGGEGGLAGDDLRVKAESVGAGDVLFKPVSGEHLLAAVRRCLGLPVADRPVLRNEDGSVVRPAEKMT